MPSRTNNDFSYLEDYAMNYFQKSNDNLEITKGILT